MNDARSRIITALLAFVPYLLVSWGYMALVNGNSKDFWAALGVLVGVRFFFSIIETLGSILAWRLHGRTLMIKKHLEFLRAHKFPPRKYAHDGVLAYLSRIEDEPEYSAALRATAREMRSVLELCDDIGILVGMRMISSAEAALEQYSPRSSAPVFGANAA